MGFKAFYTNKSLLKEEENIAPYIDLVTSTNERMKGALSYLRGMTREAAVNALRSLNDPLTSTVSYAIICTIFGALSSLVLAAFMKKG